MLLYNIESMAKKMEIDYQEVTSHIDHMGLRGSARENILREYIKQLLPQKYAVGSGIITDVKGTQSKQQDFIIYDAFNSPSFLQVDSGSVVLPVESIFATIEVKSCLSKAELEKSIDNIRSVKELELSVFINSPVIPNQYNKICGSIFSYTSDSSLSTIAQNVYDLCKDAAKEYLPSMICVLDKGLIVNVSKNDMRNITTLPSEDTTWGIIEKEKENNLYLFYLLLQQHLSTAVNFPPNLFQYASAAHTFDDMKVSIPHDMIPDDLSVPVGNTNLSGEELRFLGETHEIFFKLTTGQFTTADFKKYGKTAEELEEIVKKVSPIINRSFESNDNAGISDQRDENAEVE